MRRLTVLALALPLCLAPWHYAELFAAWEAGNMTLAKSLQDEVRKYVNSVIYM